MVSFIHLAIDYNVRTTQKWLIQYDWDMLLWIHYSLSLSDDEIDRKD